MVISGHFFAICMFIFHKTEVQTVILRCLTSLTLNWYKRYDKKCKKKKNAKNANEGYFYKIAKIWKWKCLHFFVITLKQISV